MGNHRINSPPHSTMSLSYMQEMSAVICVQHSAGEYRHRRQATSGEQQAEERYGRVVFIILLHSLSAFLISQTIKTRSQWRPNSQIQRRFMLQSQGLRATSRGELNKQVLWRTRLTTRGLETLRNLFNYRNRAVNPLNGLIRFTTRYLLLNCT